MKRLLFFSLILSSIIFSQAQIDLILTVTDDSTGIANLHFGLDPLATDSIDQNLGEEEYPPYPPTGIFDARFIGDDIGLGNKLGLGVQKDFRTGDANFKNKKMHEIRFQPGKGSVINVKWDFPAGLSATLKDLFGGVIVNVQCVGKGNQIITNTIAINKLTFEVNYQNFTEVEKDVNNFNFNLMQNYPNPFNPTTTIEYEIPLSNKLIRGENDNKGFVTLNIFDVLGRKVDVLVNEPQNSGRYSVIWNALKQPSGIYYVELRHREFRDIKKMILIK